MGFVSIKGTIRLSLKHPYMKPGTHHSCALMKLAASVLMQMPDANHAQHTYAWCTPLGAKFAFADLG